MTDTPITHAGFAAIIGAPNAGKSTLTNRLVGTKVAIVTHKVQTTRSGSLCGQAPARPRHGQGGLERR